MITIHLILGGHNNVISCTALYPIIILRYADIRIFWCMLHNDLIKFQDNVHQKIYKHYLSLAVSFQRQLPKKTGLKWTKINVFLVCIIHEVKHMVIISYHDDPRKPMAWSSFEADHGRKQPIIMRINSNIECCSSSQLIANAARDWFQKKEQNLFRSPCWNHSITWCCRGWVHSWVEDVNCSVCGQSWGTQF